MSDHPKHDELTQFLYDELSPSRHAEVAAHVGSCDACRATVESWRGVRTNLAAWKLPDASVAASRTMRTGSTLASALRWTAAAAVLLAAGYGVARMTERPAAAAVDLAAVRADLVRDVRQEVRKELAAELTKHTTELTAAQREFQEQVIDAMDKLETRQVVNQATMRKDVETLAVHTQAEFNRWLTLIADATGGDDGVVAPTAQ